MAPGTFGITGIPPPPCVRRLTKTIPHAPELPLRLEISKLFPSDDDFVRKQWTLSVLGLERFKALPVDEKLSYFQIAGIHGYPGTAWDDVDAPSGNQAKPKPGEDPFGGYCAHNGINFPTWHRPYLLLYEQCIWLNMKEVIASWQLEADQNKVWHEAASTWRLPYWDWARRQSYNNEFALPYVVTLREVPIYPPSGRVSHASPLWGFENPEKDDDGNPLRMGHMPEGKTQWNVRNSSSDDQPELPWAECTGVSRYGISTSDMGKTYTGLNGINNFTHANAFMSSFTKNMNPPYSKDDPRCNYWSPPGMLADCVSRMFSPGYNTTWGTFASTKWWAESEKSLSTGYLSLEFIHNNVHVRSPDPEERGEASSRSRVCTTTATSELTEWLQNIAGGLKFFDGGVGHLSDVPVAAFDPLFWLHHCNIDRLTAMWQVLNWHSWWDTPEPEYSTPNVPDAKSYEPLKPFHTMDDGDPDTDFWTSDMVRDWTKLHYQYDDLAPQATVILTDGSLDEEQYIADLRAYLATTYAGTGELITAVTENEHVSNKSFFGVHNVAMRTWNDYLINVVYDRYALNGRSYGIQFYLGGAPDDPSSTLSFEENLVGQVHSFGGLPPASTSQTGCSNCGTQQDGEVLSRAQVPITMSLVVQALDSSHMHIDNMTKDSVALYLRKHLHWKFVAIGGTEAPAEWFPNTKISVWAGKGKMQHDPRSGVSLLPMYSAYHPLHAVTENKVCGLGRDDAAIGVSQISSCNFRSSPWATCSICSSRNESSEWTSSFGSPPSDALRRLRAIASQLHVPRYDQHAEDIMECSA